MGIYIPAGITTSDIGSISGTGADNRIPTFTDATNIQGEANLTFDGSTLDVNGSLVVDGSNISLDSTSTVNIDNSNTSNGIGIGTNSSGTPISIGHTTSEVTVNDNFTVTGTTDINNVVAIGDGGGTPASNIGLTVDHNSTSAYPRLLNVGNGASAIVVNSGGNVELLQVYPASTVVNASVTAAHVYTASFYEPRIDVSATSAAVTTAATVYIEGAASEATNNYALWVDSGVSRFDDKVAIGTATSVAQNLHLYTAATTGAVPLPVLSLEVSDDGADTAAGEGPAINFYIADSTTDSTGSGTIYARKGAGNSHLAGQIATVRISPTDAVGSGDMTFATAENAGALVEHVRIGSDGYVGIATVDPDSPLHIRVANEDLPMFKLEADMGTNNNRILTISTPATDSASEPFRINTGNSLSFEIDGTERIELDSSGHTTFAGGVSFDSYYDASTRDNVRFKSQRTTGDATYLRIGRYGTADDGMMQIGNNFDRNDGFVADNTSVGVSAIQFETDGSLDFQTAAAGQAQPTSKMKIGYSVPTVTIGTEGTEDTAVVFAGNELTYHVGLDDGTNRVTIGTGTTAGSAAVVAIGDTGYFLLNSSTSAGSMPQFRLTNTANDSTSAYLDFWKSRGAGGGTTTTLDSDTLGIIRSVAYNDSNATHPGSTIVMYLLDNAAGDEDFQMNFQNNWASTNENFMVANHRRVSLYYANSVVLKTSNMGIGINEDTNSDMTMGITINQGANDDEILAFKSSDVAHGMTDLAETDTYGVAQKAAATTGGTKLMGFAEGGIGLRLEGLQTSCWTGEAADQYGAATIQGWVKSSATGAALSADQNVLAIATGNTVRLIVKGDGDIYMDTVVNENQSFDIYDDIALLDTYRAVSQNRTPDARGVFQGFTEENAKVLEEAKIITRNDDGHHFVSTKGLNGLIIDSIRQVNHKLEAKIKRLEDKLLALEGA